MCFDDQLSNGKVNDHCSKFQTFLRWEREGGGGVGRGILSMFLFLLAFLSVLLAPEFKPDPGK